MQLGPTGSGPASPLFPAPITVVRMRTALTRGVSPSIGQCELTHLERQPIDFEVALSQHKRYEQVLEDLGCQIERLGEESDFPDSVFVEDIAIVLDELAIITRPGAISRRGERESVESALRPHRRLEHVQAPAILDGGDVLVVGKDIYVGISSRSDSEAVDQVRAIVTDYGYDVGEVNVCGCLHLKSAVTALTEDTLIINPDWVVADHFLGRTCIQVVPSEPNAANVLRVGDTILFAASFPRTGSRLASAGFEVRPVDASELAKAEGALTCCSLLFDSAAV